MCVGIPAQITAITEGIFPTAQVDFAGEQRTCNLMYVPEAQVGDWVLLQHGAAISILSEADAQATLAALEEIRAPQAAPPRPLA